MLTSQLTWTLTRAVGLLAFLLATTSVVFGLILHHRWRSVSWPRFVTSEVHRFLSLLTLLAIAGHGGILLLDPYLAPTPLELVVPLTISYRPVWVAAGILSADLLVALWLSQYLQSRLGYRTWARLHLATYAAWVLALVHGLAAGSDTTTPWALALYAASVALVGGLFLARLLDAPPGSLRLAVAVAAGTIFVLVAAWAVGGPLTPDWSTRAGSAPARGEATVASAVTGSLPSTREPGPTGAPWASPGAEESFSVPFEGEVWAEATGRRRLLVIGGRFGGPPEGTFQVALGSTRDPAEFSRLVLSFSDGRSCAGIVTDLTDAALLGRCQFVDGTLAEVRLAVASSGAGQIAGTLRLEAITPGGEGPLPEGDQGEMGGG